MSTGWYYMANSWLRKSRRVGPITEADLLMRIDKGHIDPRDIGAEQQDQREVGAHELCGPRDETLEGIASRRRTAFRRIGRDAGTIKDRRRLRRDCGSAPADLHHDQQSGELLNADSLSGRLLSASFLDAVDVHNGGRWLLPASPIEQNRAYSIGYAIALGLAAFVVMAGFINNIVFVAGLLVLIGYLSDRIVHDCTLIDESVDASGQGLIDAGHEFVQQQMEAGNQIQDEQASADEPPAKINKRKAHQPGRTVMYLALAALPMFGIGQFLMRGDPATWASSLKYLALYLFSSLSLLVTTSFLGLRRYLRQRKVDMPTDVSVAWLAGGLVIIAAILGIAYLSPLPGRVLASIEMPAFLTTPPGKTASKHGWGDEAAEKTTKGAASTPNEDNQEGKDIESTRSQEGAPPGDSGDGKGKQGPAGKQKGGKQSGGQDGGKQGDQGKPKSSGQKSSGEKSAGQKSGEKPAIFPVPVKVTAKQPARFVQQTRFPAITNQRFQPEIATEFFPTKNRQR